MPHIYSKKLMVTIIALIIAINCKGLVDEQARQARAQQFGNKTANLGELEIIVDSLNANNPFSGIKYAVPAFFGISHDSVVLFLRQIKFPITIIDEGGQKRVFDPPEGKDKTAYDYLMDQWEWFKKNQPLDAPKLMPAAKENLANIRNVIFFAFNSRLLTLPLGDQEKLLEFLNRAKAEERLNMVRSTGHEDTKEWANAGGNETISSVIPSIDFITKAIEKVEESNFSERSFNLKKLAPSKELIHADPFLPGLLQIMICERPGKEDEIPVSGVMFSQEAEGQTLGVVSINATWGHGEGVVNGLVRTDQFYVGPTGVVHSLISAKPERVKTNDKYKLSTVDNLPPITVPCLTAREVNALVYAARVTQEHYGCPQDLEFVIQGNTIYLVQTRPIVNMVAEPSYLKENYLTTLKEENKKDVFFIGAGGGAVRIIESENELVIADNIRKALDDFLDRPDKQQIKAVVIGTLAPPTSHEATNFRGAEKPVIYMPDMSLIKRWLQENKTVLIDTQRSIIVSFIPTPDIPSHYDVIEQNSWISHPITKKTTITNFCNGALRNQPSFQDVMSFLTMDPMSNIHASVGQHIELLKQARTKTEALGILKSLLLRITQRITYEKGKQKDLVTQMAETNLTLIRDLERIHFQLRLSAYELWSMGEHWFSGCQTPQERIKILYPIVFLEAAIMQIPHAQEFIDDYSFGSLLKTEKQEEVLVQKLKLASQKYRSYYVQLAKAEDDALVESLTENWHNFVQHFHELSITDGHQSKCIGIVEEIQQLGLMPLWMNTSFESATKKYGQDYKEIADTLIEEYQGVADELKWCKSMQDKIAAFGRARIDDPKEFASLMSTFAEDIFKPMTNDDFLKKYDSLPELAKLSWLVTAQKFVDVFDGSIKTLERSQLYTDKLSRAERFYEMVGYYFSTLQSWSSIPSLAPLLDKMVDQHTFKTMAEYLEHINQLLTVIKPLMSSERQIQFSQRFNVFACAIGSQALWSISVFQEEIPSAAAVRDILKKTQNNKLITAEDIFSLTHENLKTLISVLFKQTSIMGMDLPELLSINRQNVESISTFRSSPFLRGITFGASDVVFWYDLPLRHHSSTMQVTYDRKNKECSTRIQFFGLEFRDRWAVTAQLAYLLTYLTDITFADNPDLDTKRGELSFSFKIQNRKQSETVIHYIEFLQHLLYEESYRMPVIVVSEIVQKPSIDVANTILNLRTKNLDILYKKYISNGDFSFANLCQEYQKVEGGSTDECIRFLKVVTDLAGYAKYIPVEVLFKAIKVYLQSHDIPDPKVLDNISYIISIKLCYAPYWDERMKAQLENLLAFLVDSKFKNVQQQILLLNVIDALVKKNVPSSFGLAKMLMREALQDDNELIKRKGMSLLEHLTGADVINSAEARNLLEPIVHGKSAALKKTASDLIASL